MNNIHEIIKKYVEQGALRYQLFLVLLFILLILKISSSQQANAGFPTIPADINILKEQTPTESECIANTGQSIELDYSINLNPLGEVTPKNVILFDQLPPGSELTTSLPNGCEIITENIPPACNFEGDEVVRCDIGDLIGALTTSLSLTITPTAEINAIINSACAEFESGTCNQGGVVCDEDEDCPAECIVNKCDVDVCSLTPSVACGTDIDCPQLNTCDGNNECVLDGQSCTETDDCNKSLNGACENDDNTQCTESTASTSCNPCNFTTETRVDTVSCTVVGNPNVTISKISTSNPEGQCVNADEPSNILYAITLDNIGDATASSPEVTDQLPQGASVESILINGDPTDKCTVSNGQITCNLDDLSPGSQIVISVAINLTPKGDEQIVNSATVKFSDASQTDEAIVCVNTTEECNSSFNGVFCNTITVLPDSTTLSINVDSDSSLSGIFNTGSLQGVEIAAVCAGDIASFTGLLDGTCEVTGTLSLINPNLINITGSTSDNGCDAPFSLDGTLIRLGTGGGDTGSGDGTNSGNQGGSGGGCSIAQNNSHPDTKSIFLYLLIPTFLVLRRVKNRIVKTNFSSSKSSNWLKTLLIIATAVAGFCFIGNSTAVAQSNCGSGNSLLSSRADCQEITASATQPEEVLTQLLSINSQKQFKTIRSHLAELRAGGGSNASLQSLARRMRDPGSTPLLAFNTDASSITNLSLFNQAPENGSDTFSRLGAFLNGSFNFGDRENVNNSGYDFDIFNSVGGLDYRFTDYLIIGASFNYTYTDADLKSSNGQFTSNAYYGTLYGSLYWESFYVDALGSIGGANYDIERAIDNSLQKGKPSGVLYQLAISTGYEFYKNGFSFTPYGRLEYDQNNLGSYTERTVSGDPALALKFRKQEVKSFTSALGAQAAYNWSINWGVIRPEILFEWIHEFEDNPDTVTASFVSSQALPGNPTFSVNPPSVDANFFNLGGGLYAIFPHGFSIFVYYERTLAYNDMNANYITGGLRKEF